MIVCGSLLADRSSKACPKWFMKFLRAILYFLSLFFRYFLYTLCQMIFFGIGVIEILLNYHQQTSPYLLPDRHIY